MNNVSFLSSQVIFNLNLSEYITFFFPFSIFYVNEQIIYSNNTGECEILFTNHATFMIH